MDADVIVVGGGLSGLRCALALKERGLKPMVLEAQDAVGGRVGTDRVSGFQLDRGFQVLLTAYPECRDILDYDALRLGHFSPGAQIRRGGRWHRLRDPWRAPSAWFEGAVSPIGTFADKLRLARLRYTLRRASVAAAQQGEDGSTLEYLRAEGFSESMIEGFFRPFYTGIFLESELQTSARMFRFVFKMFSEGTAALPAEGMQAIPAQMASHLEEDELRLQTPVATLVGRTVTLEDGNKLQARAVVLATDMTTARRLSLQVVPDRGWQSTDCHYFAAPRSPLPGKLIALNAAADDLITNIAIPSDVCATYAPPGRSLICVSTRRPVDAASLLPELREWFGAALNDFEHLRSYEIRGALPRQHPGDLTFGVSPEPIKDGVWLCGDYLHSSSLEGALATGRRVGEVVGERLNSTEASNRA